MYLFNFFLYFFFGEFCHHEDVLFLLSILSSIIRHWTHIYFLLFLSYQHHPNSNCTELMTVVAMAVDSYQWKYSFYVGAKSYYHVRCIHT